MAIVGGQLKPSEKISPDALSLIQGMLTIDPATRFSMRDVYAHRWISAPTPTNSTLKSNGDSV